MVHMGTLVQDIVKDTTTDAKIVTHNEAGIVEWCTRSFAEYCGMSVDKAIGKHISLLVGSHDTTNYPNANSVGLPTYTPQHVFERTNFTCPVSGRQGSYESYVVPTGVEHSLTIGYIPPSGDSTHISSDVEREIKAIQQLRRSLIDNFRHELRTPILQILGNLRLMQQNPDTVAIRELAKDAEQATNRLRSTLENIVDLSKLQAGVYPTKRRPANIQELVEGCVMTFAKTAEQKGLTLTFDTSEDSVYSLVDPYAFVAAVEHVLNNAVNYTHSGSICVRVCIDDAKAAKVEISDTGIGMSASFVHRACEPFSQEQHSTNRDYEGNGVGLTLTQKLVLLNRGTLSISSTKGVGTTVILSYPLWQRSS